MHRIEKFKKEIKLKKKRRISNFAQYNAEYFHILRFVFPL
jgi:hypothetical protein